MVSLDKCYVVKTTIAYGRTYLITLVLDDDDVDFPYFEFSERRFKAYDPIDALIEATDE